MIHVTTLQGISGGVQQTAGNLVVVRDEYGNPIVVVQEVQTGVTVVITANDPDFQRVIAGLGLDKVAICRQLVLNRSVPDGAELIAGPGKELIL